MSILATIGEGALATASLRQDDFCALCLLAHVRLAGSGAFGLSDGKGKAARRRGVQVPRRLGGSGFGALRLIRVV